MSEQDNNTIDNIEVVEELPPTETTDGRDMVQMSVFCFDCKRIIRNNKHWCSSID